MCIYIYTQYICMSVYIYTHKHTHISHFMSTCFLYYKQNLKHRIVLFLTEYEFEWILSFQQIQITYASTAHPYLRIWYGMHIHQHLVCVIQSGCHCHSLKSRTSLPVTVDGRTSKTDGWYIEKAVVKLLWWKSRACRQHIRNKELCT